MKRTEDPAPDALDALDALEARMERHRVRRRLALLFGIPLGLLLSPLGFAFGGWAALPAALGGLPGLRLLRPFGATLLVGVVVALLWGRALGNPLTALARERVLDEMEVALGARPEFVSCDGDPREGLLRFQGLRADLPDVDGALHVSELEIRAGWGFLFPAETISIQGQGVVLSAQGAGDGFKRWAKRLETGGDQAVEAEFRNIEASILGPKVSLLARIDKLTLEPSEDGRGFVVHAGPRELELTLRNQTHLLQAAGLLTVQQTPERFVVSADLHLRDEEAGGGILRGTLQESFDVPGGMVATLDGIDIEPVWSRYRAMDRFRGTVKGTVAMAGTLESMRFRPDLEIAGLDYYHRSGMLIDEDRSFRTDRALLGGELVLRDGEKLDFRDVLLEIEEATLATDPAMTACGGGQITLAGTWPELAGKATVTAREALVRQGVSFSSLGAGLDEIEPNIVVLLELLPSLSLEFDLSVERMELACDPLFGVLSGDLRGRLKKTPASTQSSIRLQGSLWMTEGRFAFLGARGSVDGSLTFRPDTPPENALLEGTLVGGVDGAPLLAIIGGRLTSPAFAFEGLTTTPEQLGEAIYEAGWDNLTLTGKIERRAALNRVCGPVAAFKGNPFLGGEFLEARFEFSFRE